MNTTNEKRRRVLVIGWDGADWKVASPLIDDGKMPNLKRLIETGVMGNISTLYPVLSPMLWTSIATGKRAHKHGIHGFAEPDPVTGGVRPITNLGRKCKAIWNILGQTKHKCNVVGWWPSNPAEPINGVMVSNHFQTPGRPGEKGQWRMRPGTVHPASLQKQLAKFRVHPGELEADQILPFVPNAAKIDQEKDKRLSAVAKTLAETSSIQAVATAIMQHEPWDFMGVYFDGIDHFSHGFMKFHPPREEWIAEEDFELYKNVIETAYRFHDIMLGAMMKLADDDTTIVLLSDHGFHPDHLRPKSVSNEPAGPADEHRQFGMLVLNGPGIKQDELVFGASLLDITPTLLTLFDLPIGRDMDGKPLLSIYEDPPEPEFIDSWESVEGDDGRHPKDLQVDPVDAHESMRQLVELGYVDEPDEDKEQTVRNTIRELRYNLARDYMDSRQFPEAISELTALWDEFPDESRFAVKLFSCYLTLERVDDAEATFKKLAKEKSRYARESAKELQLMRENLKDTEPEDIKEEDRRKLRKLRRRATTNPHAMSFLHGSLLAAKGEFEEALVALKKVDGVQTHHVPSLRQKIGSCQIGLNNWEEAKREFNQMLSIDPANAQAYLGLAQCELADGKPRKALAAARSSIGLLHQNPKAHYLGGRALLKLSQVEPALKFLQTALRQNTVFPDCHELVAKVYRKRGDIDKAEEHEKLAESAQERLNSFKLGKPLPTDGDLGLDVAMNQPLGIGEVGAIDASFKLQDTVIIVSGLPRSGTSMMMQMLDAGGIEILTDQVRKADASNPKGYFEFELAKQMGKKNDWVADGKGKAVKIIAQLIPGLPRDIQYRIIYLARPLSEVVASQTKMLTRMGKEGAKLSDRQLAATYKKQVDYVQEVLTKNKNVAAITVDFADAVRNPIDVAQRINQFLGGDLNEAAMAAVIDPTLKNEGIAQE